MNLDQLRTRTREEHEATEALLPLMGEELTRAAYQRALNKLYPIVRGWELWSEDHAPEPLRPLLQERKRSPLLLRDLSYLQQETVPDFLPFAAFADLLKPQAACASGAFLPGVEARFAGALYVVEGSTLGGQYIARHVEEVLGFRPGEGDAYFRGHGEHTGVSWHEVKRTLGALPEAMLDEAVEGARFMFGVFAKGLA